MTTTSPGWHVSDGDLTAYVHNTCSGATALSVEAHVVRCPECRQRVATRVQLEPLEAIWREIEEQAQAPRGGLVESALKWARVPAVDRLLIAAAPSLRAAWGMGALSAVLFAVLASLGARGSNISLFLLAAPLAPVLGVALAYGPDADPSHELVLAAPYSSVRLALIRTVSVVGVCLPLVAVGGLVLPTSGWSTAAWLLPAFAGVCSTLAASTWIGPTRAGLAVGVCWCVAVLVTARRGEPTALLTPDALSSYAVVVVVATAVFGARLRLLNQMGRVS